MDSSDPSPLPPPVVSHPPAGLSQGHDPLAAVSNASLSSSTDNTYTKNQMQVPFCRGIPGPSLSLRFPPRPRRTQLALLDGHNTSEFETVVGHCPSATIQWHSEAQTIYDMVFRNGTPDIAWKT